MVILTIRIQKQVIILKLLKIGAQKQVIILKYINIKIKKQVIIMECQLKYIKMTETHRRKQSMVMETHNVIPALL